MTTEHLGSFVQLNDLSSSSWEFACKSKKMLSEEGYDMYTHGLFNSHFYTLPTLAAQTGCSPTVGEHPTVWWDGEVSPICLGAQLLPRRMCDWLSLLSSLPPKHVSRKSEIWQ